jgi:hypothetical protein
MLNENNHKSKNNYRNKILNSTMIKYNNYRIFITSINHVNNSKTSKN